MKMLGCIPDTEYDGYKQIMILVPISIGLAIFIIFCLVAAIVYFFRRHYMDALESFNAIQEANEQSGRYKTDLLSFIWYVRVIK
jgi:hypothetical protein